MRETLYEDLNPVRRSRLHRQIAETLDDVSDPRARAALAELAYHFFQAAQGGGDADKAVAYAAEAGEWAVRVLAWEEAVLQYRRALAVIDMAAEPDDAQRGEMVLRLGQVLSKAGAAPGGASTGARPGSRFAAWRHGPCSDGSAGSHKSRARRVDESHRGQLAGSDAALIVGAA